VAPHLLVGELEDLDAVWVRGVGGLGQGVEVDNLGARERLAGRGVRTVSGR